MDRQAAGSIAGSGGTAAYIEKFLASFESGRRALISGDADAAEKDLLKARSSWPEYFDTDFLLALTYERLGKQGKAAAFYKSYLNKLKSYYSGSYRISGPIIYNISDSAMLSYDEAYRLISARLAMSGIDLDRVRPAASMPISFVPAGIIALLCAIYMLLRYLVAPEIRKRQRVKNPPEGFWVCARCGEENPVPALECQRCGRRRSG